MKLPFLRQDRTALATPRPLRSADGVACAGLHATSFAHPWSSAEFENLLLDPACLGEGIDGKIGLAGFILSRCALDEAEILTVVVDPRARRHGYAQRLLSSHLARLAGRGVAALFLEVDESNIAALALYRRNGFAQQGVRKAYYAKADGSRANALVMRRELA